jgi:hypothetical protein
MTASHREIVRCTRLENKDHAEMLCVICLKLKVANRVNQRMVITRRLTHSAQGDGYFISADVSGSESDKFIPGFFPVSR